jgi:capsular exopolysaccharide synthesis family protein
MIKEAQVDGMNANLRTGAASSEGGASQPAAPEAYTLSPDVVMVSAAHDEQAESIRTLRTHIMAQHVEDGRRGLAICGASRDVGCTFVAVNLAVALSQIGINTLLIDGDLRHPSIHRLIQPSKPVPGLWQALATDEGAADHIQSAVLPNLSILYAGGATQDAQELLASDNFKDMIDRCLRDFDVTIIDTPAANSCADARRISTVIGYSVIVAQRNKSFVGDISALAAQLHEDRARVVGTVMNEG